MPGNKQQNASNSIRMSDFQGQSLFGGEQLQSQWSDNSLKPRDFPNYSSYSVHLKLHEHIKLIFYLQKAFK